ncbi:MAG: nitroreductase family protein [Reinekea sp.]
MDAIELLTTRSSTPRLEAPAPSGDDWQTIQRAALRAPDHAGLTPWRFIVFNNEVALAKLGEYFVKATVLNDSETDAKRLEKVKGLTKRAPMIIAVIARFVEHPNVPRVEQIASTSCAAFAMQQAAFALGYGSIWRTGPYAHHPHMKDLLGLNDQDEIVGYLYIGTPKGKVKIKQEKIAEPYFSVFGT